MSIRIVQRVTIIVLTLLGIAAPVRAQNAVAQFYKNRQITLVIPSSVGGGYDLYGRLVARHIGKYIPGNPNVVPSNMSGAAGVVAAQYTYASGAKDGTVLAELYPNAIMAPLLGDAGQVKYDPLKFNYIGSASAETFICFVRAAAPVKSFADALTHDVILGRHRRRRLEHRLSGALRQSARGEVQGHCRLSGHHRDRPRHRKGRNRRDLRFELVDHDDRPSRMAARRQDARHRPGKSDEPSRHRQARRALVDQFCEDSRSPPDHGIRLHAVELRPALRDGAGSAGRAGRGRAAGLHLSPAGSRPPRRSQDDESRNRSADDRCRSANGRRTSRWRRRPTSSRRPSRRSS